MTGARKDGSAAYERMKMEETICRSRGDGGGAAAQQTAATVHMRISTHFRTPDDTNDDIWRRRSR